MKKGNKISVILCKNFVIKWLIIFFLLVRVNVLLR